MAHVLSTARDASLPLPWAVRRLDREVSQVLGTLLGRRQQQRWWEHQVDNPKTEDSATSSVAAVLEDTVKTHLPAVDSTAAHLVLLRALLAPSGYGNSRAGAQVTLPAAVYVQLLETFDLGQHCARAFMSLKVGRETSSLLSNTVGEVASTSLLRLADVAQACREHGAESGAALERSRAVTSLAVALLGICSNPITAPIAAAAMRAAHGGRVHIPYDIASFLVREAISGASQAAEHEQKRTAKADCNAQDRPNGTPEQTSTELVCGLIEGHAMCAASLLDALACPYDVELVGLCNELKEALERLRAASSSDERRAEALGAWRPVLEVLQGQDSSVAPLANGVSAAELNHQWKLRDVDREALRPMVQHLPAELLPLWPALDSTSIAVVNESARPARATDGPRVQQQELVVDLYADPAARAAQDALTAALPPGKRAETLLTASNVKELDKTIEPLLGAWGEAPETVAAVLLRRSADGAPTWPTAVLAPVLHAIVLRKAQDWQIQFGDGLPSDRSLFDALWAKLCTVTVAEHVESAANFLPWALGSLCIARLSPTATARDQAFATHVADRIAKTLQADLNVLKAGMELEAIMAEMRQPSEAGATAPKGTMLSSVDVARRRLAGLKIAPVSSTLLSLAELVESTGVEQGSSAVESADASLDVWCRLLSSLSTHAACLSLSEALSVHLARAKSASSAFTDYGRWLFAVSLPCGGSRLPKGDDGMIALMRACVHLGDSLERAQALHEVRASVKDFDAMRTVTSAIRQWPVRKLEILVLEVLPLVIDECIVKTPQGAVVGKTLQCTCPPFVIGPVQLPILRCIHCMMCCGLACVHSGRVGKSLLMRRLISVVRAAATEVKNLVRVEDADSTAHIWTLCGLFGGFLYSLFGGVLPQDADRSVSQSLVSAGLLLRSLRLAAEGVQSGTRDATHEAEAWCRYQHVARSWMLKVEAVAAAA